MNVPVGRCWGVLVLGAGVALAAPALPAEGQAKAAAAFDLSGHWRLNTDLSDDEQAKERAAVEAKAESDSRPSGQAEGEGPGAKRAAGAPGTLTIAQVESEIVVEETPGQTRHLYPNGKTYKADEGTTQIRTSWKDGKLVVERKNVRGWRLVETWELAPDRGRVFVHMLLQGGSRPKLSLTRVYDRDEAGTPK